LLGITLTPLMITFSACDVSWKQLHSSRGTLLDNDECQNQVIVSRRTRIFCS